MSIDPNGDRGAAEAGRFGLKRSPLWPAVARAHLVMQPQCVACASGASPTEGLQVHHVVPFHICVLLGRPELELDARNLITLCEREVGKGGDDHHLLIGHLDDFQSLNLNVGPDARGALHAMSAATLRANAAWAAEVARRLKPLEQMTPAEKTALRAEMDARMPVLATAKVRGG